MDVTFYLAHEKAITTMPLTLDYQDLRTFVRRRGRVFVWGTLLVLFTVIALWKGNRIVSAIELQYYQWRCLRFTKSGTTIAYDSDDKEMAALSAGDDAYCQDADGYGYKPNSLAALIALRKFPYCPAIIFMHERVSHGGHRRLVFVGTPEYLFGFRRNAWIPVEN
jgi:hypothetical protein